jgi:3-oxoadipate enol-lactonase
VGLPQLYCGNPTPVCLLHVNGVTGSKCLTSCCSFLWYDQKEETSTTQVGSHTVYYDESGAGHPLIFMSGLASTRMGWWKQIEPFAKKFRVINLDNRDAGDSALGTGPYTIADMAEDIAGVVKNLNLGRAHIVGISMGGMIAQELAIRHPDLVDKLVLVSTTAGGPTGVNAKPEIAALLMRNEGEDIETRVRRTFTAIAGEGYMAKHPEDLDQIVKNSVAKPMSLESYQRQLGACIVHFGKGTTERLAQITAPTLVVHGDYDPLIPYPNGKYLAEHIKGAQLATYPGVGHLSPIEASERFNRELIEFLE